MRTEGYHFLWCFHSGGGVYQSFCEIMGLDSSETWWRHCCWAQRLSGVQWLSRKADVLYSYPIPNLSWDQAFLFNKALILKSHLWKFSIIIFYPKRTAWLRHYFLLLAFYDKPTARFWVLRSKSKPKFIIHHDWQLVQILRQWLIFSFWA